MRLDELAKQIGGEVVGDGSLDITSVATLDEAQAGQISFFSNHRYAEQVKTTKASAVILAPNQRAEHVALVRAKDPYLAFQKVLVLLHGQRKHPHQGIHPRALVDPAATIGENTVIYPGAYVGPRAKVGRDCILYPNVTIYDDCILGDRVIIHSGTAIGSDGFGYATSAGVHHKIPQAGHVVIEDDVEIGSNCNIARAALGATRIGAGTKIDGLVMVGHGAEIGRGCLLVAQVGISGSTNVGNYVVMGGQVGVAGHLTIGDQVQVGAQSGVMTDLEPKTIHIGSPAMPAQHARRVYSLLQKFPEVVDRIRELEKQVQELDDSGDTPMV